MLTKEQDFFIKALADFINKIGNSEIPQDIDIESLADYAKKHEVEAILYCQTHLQKFLPSFASAVYSSTNRENMLQKLCSALDISYFVLKGSCVSQFYPVPMLRTMGDIDFVVHTEDREKVHEILLKQGYECESKNPDREWQYFKDRRELELHDHLIYKENVNNSKQETFFNDFWPYVHNNTLDLSFHFLFLISHLRKHFMNEGVGFRQFMDIAVVAKYGKLDWSWIEETANEIELLPFLKTVLAFVFRWFAVDTPIECAKIAEEFYEISTAKIFEDGVFGFGNIENRGSAAINLYLKDGKIGTLKATLHQIFPPYREMKDASNYAFVTGKPFLLPFAWVYRIVMKSKNKGAVKMKLGETITSTEAVRKREEMYRQWGL